MFVLGLDPGKGGGVAIVGAKLCAAAPMPVMEVGSKWEVDVARLIEWFESVVTDRRAVNLAAIEQVSSRPKQGVVSTFSFGQCYGELIGAMKALDILVNRVPPQTWKAEILGGTEKDKAAAVAYVLREHPDLNLLATPRSRKPHDGMADAVCLADYAWRKLVSAG